MRTIYLDHHATTPLDPRAFEAMKPYFVDEFGNASSATHDWGKRAAAAVEKAREAVAVLIGCPADTIVFTAGATEANNIAIKGGARAAKRRGLGRHLVTTALEHKAGILSVRDLESEGFEATILQPQPTGVIDPHDVANAIRKDTVLVSVMSANSEIGTIQPIETVGEICRERGILFHTDATQSVGKLPLQVDDVQCDLLSMSAHKFYGPKGVGALYVREGVEIDPLFSGGGQEGGVRSGTLNVPGIVGMGSVAVCRLQEMAEETAAVRELRDYFWSRLQEEIPDCHLNGCLDRRLPGNLNVAFSRCEAEAIMLALDSYALSTGSACQSSKKEPSEVLVSIGREPSLANASVRFGFGKSNTKEELDDLMKKLVLAVARLRSLAPQVVR